MAGEQGNREHTNRAQGFAADLATVAALLRLPVLPARAQAANGSARGTLTAGGGKPIKLRYAYAQLQKSDDGPAKQEI